MEGITYFCRHGFSINEGSGPVNLHISWMRPWCYLFVYAYVFGRRLSFAWKRKQTK